jgi:hypothetical protein
MAGRLPGLFATEGLIDIRSQTEDEVAERGDADFGERTALWSEVIENVGRTMAEAGFRTEQQIAIARECYGPWVQTTLTKQTLFMRAVTACVP